ncbi:MAG TPA: HTH-type transcriptional repressor FabR [Limnobacter sp.]|uniref:HTH-type transcriptional repressor FabR n=1 Tax=Limnobacter sp. TaxID=2003368 RepID=UPI002EDB3576
MRSRTGSTPKPLDETQARVRRKEQTRQNLLQAALNLVGNGSSFTALGIREITREAGVVPTAFYRHFKTTDELGLALVEEGGITLRRLLREARQASLPGEDMIRHSVSVFVGYLKQHHLEWRFVSSERSGGSPVLRAAIRNEIAHFTHEMASDLRALNIFPKLATNTLQLICSVVVTLMMNSAVDFLDMKPDQPAVEREMIDNFVKQIVMVFLGAAHWEEEPTHSLSDKIAGRQ